MPFLTPTSFGLTLADGTTLTKSGLIISVKDDGIGTSQIDDGAILNADISASANISPDKISGKLWQEISAETKADSTEDNFDFTSLASGWKEFILLMNVRSTNASNTTGMDLTFNGVTGTSYSYQQIYQANTTLSAINSASQARIQIGVCPAGSGGADIFGMYTAHIVNNSTTDKTATSHGADLIDGHNRITHGRFNATTEISQITLTAQAGNFLQESRCVLLGRK